jgi:hypothetical protein
LRDHRADPLIGEQLEQHDMWNPTVEQMGRPGTGGDGVQARFGLGDHAALQCAVVE